ncbi:MAG: riboflavin synthase [Burkholderiales bacterium]
MFTGLVQAVGSIARAQAGRGGTRIAIAAGALDLADVAIGDSIAVNGCCLTVVACGGQSFEADVSAETLACTTGFAAGAPVNLEKALRLADRLGGHLMTGHVDGTGKVAAFARDGDSWRLAIDVPKALAPYVARKGSIAVHGVSLTVNAVRGARFEVNLIPHTLAQTNLRGLARGAKVNLEVDLMARYAERLAAAGKPKAGRTGVAKPRPPHKSKKRTTRGH